MNTIELTKTDSEKLLNYYEQSGPDYEHWSKAFNMHFGYYQQGMNPFNREQLLDNMNRQVITELGDCYASNPLLVDMGCGLGATLRSIRNELPNTLLKGVTIVPWQVDMARELNAKSENYEIEIIQSDYCDTPLAENSVDQVIAIESSCHARGASKAALLKEIHRILRPGGRFVIADGFRKRHNPLKGIIKLAYRTLCESWVIEQLGNIIEVEKTLRSLGFQEIKATDISWNVAPSVAHVPGTVITFLLKELFTNGLKLNKERWNNLKSPLLTMLVGLAQKDFGYYLVSGTKN